AGNVDRRAGSLDIILRTRHREAAADGEYLVETLGDGSDVTTGIEQGRADPLETVGTRAAQPGIDGDSLADQEARGRRVGDFVGRDQDAQLERRPVDRYSREPGKIDAGAGSKLDRAGGVRGAHGHGRARRGDQTVKLRARLRVDRYFRLDVLLEIG